MQNVTLKTDTDDPSNGDDSVTSHRYNVCEVNKIQTKK